MKQHCPTCACGSDDRLYMDTAAPFFPLVVAIDRLTNDAHGKSLRRLLDWDPEAVVRAAVKKIEEAS